MILVKGITDSWCTYTEGTRAESKLHLSNSKQISTRDTTLLSVALPSVI